MVLDLNGYCTQTWLCSYVPQEEFENYLKLTPLKSQDNCLECVSRKFTVFCYKDFIILILRLAISCLVYTMLRSYVIVYVAPYFVCYV